MVRFLVKYDYNKLQINQNTKLVLLPFLREGGMGSSYFTLNSIRQLKQSVAEDGVGSV